MGERRRGTLRVEFDHCLAAAICSLVGAVKIRMLSLVEDMIDMASITRI